MSATESAPTVTADPSITTHESLQDICAARAELSHDDYLAKLRSLALCKGAVTATDMTASAHCTDIASSCRKSTRAGLRAAMPSVYKAMKEHDNDSYAAGQSHTDLLDHWFQPENVHTFLKQMAVPGDKHRQLIQAVALASEPGEPLLKAIICDLSHQALVRHLQCEELASDLTAYTALLQRTLSREV